MSRAPRPRPEQATPIKEAAARAADEPMSRELTFEHVLTPAGIESQRALRLDSEGRISAIEPCDPRGPFDGWLALPGMPNAHSESWGRGLVGYSEGVQAPGGAGIDAQRAALQRLADGLDADTLYDLCWQAYREMLACGLTSVVEFHRLHHRADGARAGELIETVIRAATDAGVRQAFIPVFGSAAGFGAAAGDANPRFLHRDVEDFLTTVAMYRKHCAGVAAASPGSLPAEMLADMALGAGELLGADTPVHVPVAATAAEVEACLASTGRRPVHYLAETVELGAHWSLVHATHADASERECILASKATVVVCPLQAARAGEGGFPAAEFAAAGGRLALGSGDGLRGDPVDALRWLEYGQRVYSGQSKCFGDADGAGAGTWRRLAAGGATALGLHVGAIEIGAHADLVTLDMSNPIFATVDGPAAALDALLTSGDGRCIEQRWVGGQRSVPADGGDYASAVRRIMSR